MAKINGAANRYAWEKVGKMRHFLNFILIGSSLVSVVGRASDLEVVRAQILPLKEGEVLPTLVVSKYDSRLVAKALVERIEMVRPGQETEKPFYDFYRDTEVQMLFWDKHIGSIQKKCFLNQHQVGHVGAGVFAPKVRAQYEDRFAGVRIESSYGSDPDNPAHKIRPKYAYLGLQRPTFGVENNMASVFGNIVAVFKDVIKDRSTFTSGDSLNINASPGDVRSLHFRSSSSIKQIGDIWEAQIWGEVCFSDTKYFLVHCSFMDKLPEKSLKHLCSTGIPVYECAIDSFYEYRQWVVKPAQLACH